MLLVVTPTNVYKMESVCGDRGRINSAVFVLAHPFCSEPEQIHPVLLSNALCESCDTGTGQCVDRRCLNDALPLLNMRVSAAVGSLTVKNGYFDIARNLYTVEHIGIRKTGATYDIPYEAYVKKLDLNHIAVTGFNADIDSLKYNAGAIRARLKGLTVKEKSGLALNDMGGTLYVDSAKLELGGFKLKTPYSTFPENTSYDQSPLNEYQLQFSYCSS